MGFLAANQSKKVLENSAKCSQETRNSLCRNTLSVVLTSMTPHDLERKVQVPKTLHIWAQKTRNPSSPVFTMLLKKYNPHVPKKKSSCCPQMKPSRRSPLKPRKKVPARLRCQKRRHNVCKVAGDFSRDETERHVVVYVDYTNMIYNIYIKCL